MIVPIPIFPHFSFKDLNKSMKRNRLQRKDSNFENHSEFSLEQNFLMSAETFEFVKKKIREEKICSFFHPLHDIKL